MTPEPMHEVRVLRFPLRLYARTREHHEELVREFTLLALGVKSGQVSQDLPSRLLRLVDELSQRFASAVLPANAVRDAALAEGRDFVDLVYRVPASLATAVQDVAELLDEAEEFCRTGDQLLTVASPPELTAFRRWYLGEFTRQLAGHPPQPWAGAAG